MLMVYKTLGDRDGRIRLYLRQQGRPWFTTSSYRFHWPLISLRLRTWSAMCQKERRNFSKPHVLYCKSIDDGHRAAAGAYGHTGKRGKALARRITQKQANKFAPLVNALWMRAGKKISRDSSMDAPRPREVLNLRFRPIFIGETSCKELDAANHVARVDIDTLLQEHT